MLRNMRTLCYLKVFSQLTWGNSNKLRCISTVRLPSLINTLCPSDRTYNRIIKLSAYIVTKDNFRFKSKSHGKNVKDDDSSDEEDDKKYRKGDFDEEGGMIQIVRLKSLRIDNFLRNGYNLSRRNVDESFMGGKIRLNGQLLNKKSIDLSFGDEIELYGESTIGEIKKNYMSKLVIKKINPIPDLSVFDIIFSVHKN